MLSIKQIVTKVWEIQNARYRSKGLKNVIIAFSLLFLLFLVAPRIGRAVWPKQQIQDKASFQLMTQTFIQVFSTALYFFIYLPGYLGVKWYKKYEIDPDLKKPWERDDWKQKRVKTVFLYILNKAIIFPLYIYLVLKIAGVKLDFSYDTIPDSWQLFTTVIKVQLVDDFIYMWGHRAFHEVPGLYKYHKIHHSYETVFSMVGQYCHPVEQIFGNIIPATISFSLFRTHMFTFLFWMCYKLFMSSQGHSSYQFPWSPLRILPFVYGATYHDYHHTKNVGNYATSVYLSQLIFGTNTVFFDEQIRKFKEKQALKDKQQAKKA